MGKGYPWEKGGCYLGGSMPVGGKDLGRSLGPGGDQGGLGHHVARENVVPVGELGSVERASEHLSACVTGIVGLSVCVTGGSLPSGIRG